MDTVPSIPSQPDYSQAEITETEPEDPPQASVAAPETITEAEAQPSPEEAMASVFDLYPSVYPAEPPSLQDGANVGKLAPGGEHWYQFSREDQDEKIVERMALTLFSTPTDGNTSHYVNFQIYPGGQYQIWDRGTPEDMVPMGQGQWVSRDGDPVTGERLWAGPVLDGDTYYVRVLNGSENVIDYYLITNDVENTELGDRVYAANPPYLNPMRQITAHNLRVP